MFTRREGHARGLATGLAQEVSEHEQAAYGTRALGGGPVRNDRSETQPHSVTAWAVARAQVQGWGPRGRKQMASGSGIFPAAVINPNKTEAEPGARCRWTESGHQTSYSGPGSHRLRDPQVWPLALTRAPRASHTSHDPC